MGDRVAVIRKGELQQVADPQTLYDHPVNLFVAGFIGSPAMNLLEATVRADNGTLTVEAGSQQIPLSRETLAYRPALRAYEGKGVVLGIRPEDLEDAALAGETEHGAYIFGIVHLREALGSEVDVHVVVDAPPAITEDVKELAEDAGDDRVHEHVDVRKTTVVGRFGNRSRVKPGEEIKIAVDTRALHFFDAATGTGIYHDAPAAA